MTMQRFRLCRQLTTVRDYNIAGNTAQCTCVDWQKDDTKMIVAGFSDGKSMFIAKYNGLLHANSSCSMSRSNITTCPDGTVSHSHNVLNFLYIILLPKDAKLAMYCVVMLNYTCTGVKQPRKIETYPRMSRRAETRLINMYYHYSNRD